MAIKDDQETIFSEPEIDVCYFQFKMSCSDRAWPDAEGSLVSVVHLLVDGGKDESCLDERARACEWS